MSIYYWREFLRKPPIFYVYPKHKRVSFTLVAKPYIDGLKKYFRVYEIFELTFPDIDVNKEIMLIIHPFFFIMQRKTDWAIRKIRESRGTIAVDVADSDKLSYMAVSLLNYCDAAIVPSNFAREAYIRSGVRIPVHVVPHALEPIYYRTRRGEVVSYHPKIRMLREMKQKNKNLLYFIFFQRHSGWRKGCDLVSLVIDKIKKEYSNVRLIVVASEMPRDWAVPAEKLIDVLITEWLSLSDLVALYDLCDIYPAFSRAGGFEKNMLEAISRGVVTIACSKGSWTDFMPDFLLVPYWRKCPIFPPGALPNVIHVGEGYEISLDKAYEKIKDVIENLDEYRAKTLEWFEKIKHRYTWETVGEEFAKVVLKYYYK